ncbi:MAG: signal peptide peptidase SppA [Candidatus Dasytiphilus stammeri]
MNIVGKFIVNFFKNIWQILHFIRELIINIFVIFTLVIIINIWFITHNTQSITTIPPHSALVLNINGVVDNTPPPNRDNVNHFFQKFLYKKKFIQKNCLFNIVEAIKQAMNDDYIKGIILDLNNLEGTTQPSLSYIGKALKDFRKSGKPIYSISDNYTQDEYYLASYANRIFLSPQGDVDLHGFAVHQLYYKSMLDHLQINRHIFRVGKYKSAIEPMIRNNMSYFARQNNKRWINQFWQIYLTTVASNRKITVKQLFPDIQEMIIKMAQVGGDTAHYAYENKLVDELISRTNFEKKMIKEFGWNEDKKDFNSISIYDYPLKSNFFIKNDKNDNLDQIDNIAVLFINGLISDNKNIDESYLSTLRNIHYVLLNPKIKALILYIDSPGGSARSSELIREELLAIQEAGKPVVVSMGGTAASGGYLIATSANYIFANPNTLTGSIGIFGVINTLEKTLAKLGIYNDGIATSTLSNISISQDIPFQLKKLIQLIIKNGYNKFINIVAKSRHRTFEEIDKIAQGQVWSGLDAKKIGLIDQIGDFDDAIIKAAEIAKLNKWKVIWLNNQPSIINQIIDSIVFTQIKIYLNSLKTYLQNNYEIKNKIMSDFFNQNYKNIYAECLQCDRHIK